MGQNLQVSYLIAQQYALVKLPFFSLLVWDTTLSLISSAKKGFLAKKNATSIKARLLGVCSCCDSETMESYDGQLRGRMYFRRYESDRSKVFRELATEVINPKGKGGRGVSGKINVSAIAKSILLEDNSDGKMSDQVRYFKITTIHPPFSPCYFISKTQP